MIQITNQTESFSLQSVCLTRRPARHSLCTEASAGAAKQPPPGNEAPKPQRPAREYIPPVPPP